jgi:hypothetical protein
MVPPITAVLNNGTAQKFSASAFSFTSDPIISISTCFRKKNENVKFP